MSILGKKWYIKNHDSEKDTVSKIFENRRLGKTEELTKFHDPFMFRDMQKAVYRIKDAISKGEKIMIFGDYDVDGITATAILVHALRLLDANVYCKLPNRQDDGYGLSDKFVNQFEDEGVKLIITVDCGISCGEQVKKAKKQGIETIITDHHTIPKSLPEAAVAILHPKLDKCNYPFKELTGAGVALKLAQALIPYHLECFLDLASLGTVADLGPITGENKLIVKKGLEVLADTQWRGLQQIKKLAKIRDDKSLDTATIGFQIAPRLNAAGRIGDPKMALDLLLEQDCQATIEKLGGKLEELNRKRQEMTAEAFGQAEAMLSGFELPHIIVAHDPDWHVGILGLIAGKLVEKYGRPAIVMQDFGDTLVASARSPEYFNVTDAIGFTSEFLISYGGHAQAAGFNIEKKYLEDFKVRICEYASSKLKDRDLKSILEIDCEIREEEIGFELIEKLEELAPFGKSNEKPTFLLRSIEPTMISQVGKNNDHLRFRINNHPVIAFRMGQFADRMRQHRKIDLVFNMDKSHWNDKDYIELMALDFNLYEG